MSADEARLAFIAATMKQMLRGVSSRAGIRGYRAMRPNDHVMNNSIWDANVELAMECGDHFHVVRNAREAIACLTTHWPGIKGASYAGAREICLAGLKGTKTNAEARAAFVAARMRLAS